jgi:hypothetical protein
MKKTDSPTETLVTPDSLAKRMFALALLGVLAYVGVVMALMSTME